MTRVHFRCLLALPVALVALAGCHSTGNSARTDAPAPFALGGSYAYRYYPDVEVYYDADRDLYFWRGAGYWSVGQRLPSTYDLTGPVHDVALETDRPYRAHDQVVAFFDDAGSATETSRPDMLVDVPTE